MSEQPPNLELRSVVHELELHASKTGWDQPGRIYALVETADLLQREPDLADALGVTIDEAHGFTPIEQEALEPGREIEDVLAEIAWPDIVPGCAVVIERLVLPPEADADVPESPEEAAEYAANHPDREEVRIVVGVLRPGTTDDTETSWCALRMRSNDDDMEVLVGPDLVPGLIALLGQTLIADVGDEG